MKNEESMNTKRERLIEILKDMKRDEQIMSFYWDIGALIIGIWLLWTTFNL